MVKKLLLPFTGLAAILAALVWLLVADRSGSTAPDPPLPASLSRVEPAVLELVHQGRSAVLADRLNPQRWIELGMVFDANANPAQAATCYAQAAALEATNARAWFLLAQARYALSEYGEAIEAMRRAATLMSEYTAAHWRLGFWLLEQGDLVGAEASFTRATRQAPGDPAGWFGLAMVRMRQQRDEEAAGILEQVLEWTPVNRHFANQLLCTVYRRLGRVEDAERALLASAGGAVTWPDPWTNEVSNFHRGAGWKIELPIRLLAMGRVNESIGMLEGFLRADPDDSVLLSNLAIAYRESGQLDRSIATLEKAIDAREHYHQAHFNLGLAYLRKAERTRNSAEVVEFERLAWRHAEFALQVNPSYPSGHGLLGMLRERRGEHDEALREYRVAAADHASAQYWLERESALLAKLGRWDRAIESLQEMLIRFAPQPTYLYDLAIAQVNAGRMEAAATTVQRFARLWPMDGRVEELRRRLASPAGAPMRIEAGSPGAPGSPDANAARLPREGER